MLIEPQESSCFRVRGCSFNQGGGASSAKVRKSPAFPKAFRILSASAHPCGPHNLSAGAPRCRIPTSGGSPQAHPHVRSDPAGYGNSFRSETLSIIRTFFGKLNDFRLLLLFQPYYLFPKESCKLKNRQKHQRKKEDTMSDDMSLDGKIVYILNSLIYIDYRSGSSHQLFFVA